jgi:hypothetical protein
MLRRALFRARMSEDDVAAHLDIDPKTVRRWMEGRVPFPRNRRALSDLLGADESDLWPQVHGDHLARSWPGELRAVYPHRWAVPHDVWHQLFESAHKRIDVLAYSGLFLAEDAGLLGVLAQKANAGVGVRICLGDPESLHAAEPGVEEGTEGSMAAKIRNALSLYEPLLAASNIQMRLHSTTLYNSIYRADEDLLVNQHSYGIPAAHAPVFRLRESDTSEIAAELIGSFERIWARARMVSAQ